MRCPSCGAIGEAYGTVLVDGVVHVMLRCDRCEYSWTERR